MKNTVNVGAKAAEVEVLKYRNFAITGKHIYGNLDDVQNNALLRDADMLEKVVMEGITMSNMHVVEVIKHKFQRGMGVSIIALLAESHFAVHTWPEGNYATIDVYTCGNSSDPIMAFDHVAKHFNAKRCERYFTDRSK
jgi:S-adenosylmethionine decarboxylase